MRQKKEFPLPKCGLLSEACRILKVRNRDVWESPCVSLPEAVSTSAQAERVLQPPSQRELQRINAQG